MKNSMSKIAKKIWCMVLALVMMASVFSGTGLEASAFSPIMIDKADFIVQIPMGGREAWKSDAWTNDDGYRIIEEYENNHSEATMFNDGVAWFDETTQTYLYAGDRFVSGHQYSVYIVTIVRNNYYHFVNDSLYNQTLVDVTVNGDMAGVLQLDGYDAWKAFTVKYTFPACEEAPSDIETIDIQIQTPIANTHPDFSVSLEQDKYTFSGLDVEDYINGIAWYNVSNDTYLTQEDVFYPGNRYRIIIPLKRVEPYRFAVDESGATKVRATIAGKEAEVYSHFSAYSEDMSKYIAVAYTFEECKEPVSEIELIGIDIPVENRTPDYVVTSVDTDKYDILEEQYEPVTWLKDGSVMDKNDTFEAGYRYAVTIQVKTKDDLVFLLDENLDPAVTATLDGKSASVTKAWEQDPFEVLEVYYDFGVCNDTVIETVDVKGVVEPAVGKTPSYSAYVDGTGYEIPCYYSETCKNGISWYDVTEGEYLYPDDKESVFVAGHEYKVQMYLETLGDYNFHTEYDEILAAGWLNGQSAILVKDSEESPRNALILEYTFTCQKETVYGVRIMDLEEPRHGEAPDYSLTLDEPLFVALDENYAMGGIYWYGPDNGIMVEGDTFTAGQTYQVEIKLIPAKLKGSDTCTFANPFTASINDNEVDSNDIYASSTAVYLYYDYECTVPKQVSEVAALFDAIGSIDGSNYIKKADKVAQAQDAFDALSLEYKGFFTDASPVSALGMSYQTFLDADAFYEALGLWSTDVNEQTYTGKKITPAVDVYYKARKLVPKVDYTISYKNNVKANDASKQKTAPCITVTGKGNYTGKEVIYFKIVQKDIAQIQIDDVMVKANDKVQKPVPKITYNGKTLKNKTDFTLNYPDSVDGAYVVPGDYTIQVTGKTNFTGTKTVKLTITPYNLTSKVTVSKIPNQTYDQGKEIEPPVTVKYGKKTLKEKTDYTVSYSNNKYVGTAEVIITGIGDYTGTKKATFKIVGTPIKNTKISVKGLEEKLYYFGGAYTPDVEIKDGETDLVKNTNYTVAYSNNVKAGTATILIKGINGYTGSVKKTFKILPYNIKENPYNQFNVTMDSTAIYAKGGSKPKPVVTLGTMELKEGVDYTLSYKNNGVVNDGLNPKKVPTAIIKGKGNFIGTVKDTTFSIVAQDISKLTMSAQDKAYSTKKNGWKSAITITDLDGRKLAAGKDYNKVTYTYANDTMIGNTLKTEGQVIAPTDVLPQGTSVKVTAEGIKNYYGPISCEYMIVKKNISTMKFSVGNKTYTGKAICPDKSEIIIPADMTENDYEIVTYKNNVKKGTATVVLKGVGNYGGTKNVTFKIKARKFLWWFR